MVRFAFLLSLFILLATSSIAQTDGTQYNGDENYLRACLIWKDSTVYDRISHNGYERVVYRFEIQGLYWGQYESKEIYVSTYPKALLQFNPRLELGKTYWWILRKVDRCIDYHQIYNHSGGF